jgi:hypothetical protein
MSTDQSQITAGLEAALRAAWRPIETIPPQQEVLLTDGAVQVVGTTDEDREYFQFNLPDNRPYDFHTTNTWRPTHWAPLLPPPPEEIN